MYQRIVSPPPERLIENGRPVFGTYNSAPPRLDIRNVPRPFGVLPLPTFITNLRIRSMLSLSFCAGSHIVSFSFLNAKLFGMAELVIWDRETGMKYAYNAFTPPRRRAIPHSLENGLCFVSVPSRYARVSWNRSRKTLSLVFHMEGDSVRPSAAGAFLVPLFDADFCEGAAVLPASVMRRCRAVYWVSAAVKGSLSVFPRRAERSAVARPIEGRALFSLARAYCKLKTDTDMVFASGISRGRAISFSIAQTSFDSVNDWEANENVLFIGDEMTPLPPVRITRPQGINGVWIIQDTENMVDLTFTPISDNVRILSIFILRTTSHILYGKFEGVLLTADGTPVELRDFPGLAKKQLLRL